METVGIIVIALAGFGFAGVALALGVRNGSLRATILKLGFDLNTSELERDETREEFESYQARTKQQLERLRERLNDSEDMLAACTDPTFIHERFDQLLSEASRGLGDSGPDELP